MASAGVDMDLVRRVLREATADGGPFTQRGLAKEAGLGRDAVADIINGRSKNPTIKTLIALAEAMEKDLSVFGLYMVNEQELLSALEDSLPELPKRDHAKQAQYLLEVVQRVLELPRGLPATRTDRTQGEGDLGPDEPPRPPTS